MGMGRRLGRLVLAIALLVPEAWHWRLLIFVTTIWGLGLLATIARGAEM
jgi:hypothetical protein